MDLKPYIAIFFAVLFFGKFLMMDSNILVVLLDPNEVAYVNPFCEKHKAALNDKAPSTDLIPASDSFSIAIDSFCNAPFQFEIVQWEEMLVQTVYQHYPYTTLTPPQIFRDNYYPPPKIV